jgi:hypothetical protein
MIERLIIQADLTPRPIRTYAELWSRDVKTLNAWCSKGWIPGAFKHPSGEWWINPIALLDFDPNNQQEEYETTEKSEGTRFSRKNQDRLSGKTNYQRTARLQYRPQDAA